MDGPQETRRTTLVCPDIHCPSCVAHIEDLISSLPLSSAISHVAVSYADQTITFVHPVAPNSSSDPSSRKKTFRSAGKEDDSPIARQVVRALQHGGYSIDTADPEGGLTAVSASPGTSPPSTSAAQKGLFSTFVGRIADSVSPQRREARAREARHRLACTLCRQGLDDHGSQAEAIAGDDLEDAARACVATLDVDGARDVKTPSVDKDRSDVEGEATANGDATVAYGPWVVDFAVEGMTCASCASAITSSIQSLPSISTVGDFSVNLLANSARAIIADTAAIEHVRQAVEDAGYGAKVVRKERERIAVRARDPKPSWYQVGLSVGGMTCASCVSSITSSILSLDPHAAGDTGDSVRSFKVFLLSNAASALVSSREHAERLRRAIEEAGYEAEIVKFEPDRVAGDGSPEADQRTATIAVNGIFCKACPAEIAKELDRLFEEYPVQFDFSAFRVDNPEFHVTYTPHQPAGLTIRTFLDAVAAVSTEENTTFTASPVAPLRLESYARQIRARELRSLSVRFLLSALFAIPTLVVAIIAPRLPQSNRFRTSLMTPIVGGASKLNFVLFALTTPVQFGVGFFFYTRVWHNFRALWRNSGGRKAEIWRRRLFMWGDMNWLVAIGTSVAYLSSLAFLIIDARSPAPPPGEPVGDMSYFDASVFLLFFIIMGRVLEAWSKRRTGDAVEMLGDLRPRTGILLGRDGRGEEISVDLLEIGDHVLIPPGASPPLDSVLASSPEDSVQALDDASGRARDGPVGEFDESSLTGESKPVGKKVGEMVYVGTVNASRTSVAARVACLPGGNMLDSVLEAVRFSGRKASIERLADRVTAYFVPVIVGVALVTLIVWLGLAYGVLSADWIESHGGKSGARLLFALEFAVAVCVVACPCGIGLAAPTAQMVGIGLASSRGILVHGGGEAFQTAASAVGGARKLVVVFDKTGTITHGNEIEIVDVMVASPWNDDAVRPLLWAAVDLVEQNSTHPLGQALSRHSRSKADVDPSPDDLSLISFDELPGKGVRAVVLVRSDREEVDGQHEIWIGNRGLIEEAGASLPEGSPLGAAVRRWQEEAKSVLFIATRSLRQPVDHDRVQVAAVVSAADRIRAESAGIVYHLRSVMGAECWMVTGDNAVTASAVAAEVGIEPSRVVAGVLPVGKRDKVASLQVAGEDLVARERSRWSRLLPGRKSYDRGPLVAFVGDGINDAPALTQADISIALVAGSAAACSSADFVLMSRSAPLVSLPILFHLSRATQNKVLSNFVWAVVFNAICVPLAAGVFMGLGDGGVKLSPTWSALAMALSSISVVLNALSLRFWKPPASLHGLTQA